MRKNQIMLSLLEYSVRLVLSNNTAEPHSRYMAEEFLVFSQRIPLPTSYQVWQKSRRQNRG